MAKISKTVVDKELRDTIFNDLFPVVDNQNDYDYHKINDRQYGVLLVDANGETRYCRVGVIVAEIREDMTAEELMQKEIDEYKTKQAEKAEKAKKKEEKIAKDKAKRQKEQEEDDPNQFLPNEVTV
jgi:DNA-directed RNA polymerase delta subunit